MMLHKSQQPKALVVLSGGQDSTTCLFLAKSLGYDVHTITVDYGQRHSREIHAATVVANEAGVPHQNFYFLRVGNILQSTSPLVCPREQLEQYEDHKSLPGGIEKTFVPLRNQLFLTIAANRAAFIGADVIYTGVCQEDFGGYPDCRRVFIDALQHTINLSNEGALNPIRIETPLMDLTKAQSVELACSLPGCYRALGWSHTAYDGHYPPSGKDHASLLRAKGFEEAGVPDPLVMRAWLEGLMPLPATDNYKNNVVTRFRKLLFPMPT